MAINYGETRTVNSDHWAESDVNYDMYMARENAAVFMRNSRIQASLVLIAYNRIEKTKQCVRSILAHTADVDYELILIDNGSDRETLEYFESVEYEKKIILRFTKNSRAQVFQEAQRIYQGRYFVLIANDIVVTKNWLSNLITCYESDRTIGFAVPVSTNVSNLQEVSVPFKSLDDLHAFAAKNNISDPLRWEERMRLVNPVSVLKREILDTVGLFDYGFMHDFAEDDFAVRIRRAGYKLILCQDSFVHHDHDFRNLEDKDPEAYSKSLQAGWKNYQDKYYGLDAWEDVCNFESNLIQLLKLDKPASMPKILGVDVRMGTPILEIRNRLRQRGVLENESYAFTTQAKYFMDLQTVCGLNVYCDRIDYIYESFAPNLFDYIILGEPINSYDQPIKLLQRLLEFLKPDGQVLLKLKNINNIDQFLRMLGGSLSKNDSMFTNIEFMEFLECSKLIGISSSNYIQEIVDVEQQHLNAVELIIKEAGLAKDARAAVTALQTQNYLIRLSK